MNVFVSLPLGEDPSQLENELTTSGVQFESGRVMCCSINAGEYAMLFMKSDALKLAIGALGGWIAAKQGRRVSIRLANEEFVANNLKELEKVVEVAKKMKTTIPSTTPASESAKKKVLD